MGIVFSANTVVLPPTFTTVIFMRKALGARLTRNIEAIDVKEKARIPLPPGQCPTPQSNIARGEGDAANTLQRK